MPITTLAVVASGGALGALARYWFVSLTSAIIPGIFPIGTLMINLLGSLAIGIAGALMYRYVDTSILLKQFFIIGFLGAFTTFSAFAYDAFMMIENNNHLEALLYISCSVIGTIGLCGAGFYGTLIYTK